MTHVVQVREKADRERAERDRSEKEKSDRRRKEREERTAAAREAQLKADQLKHDRVAKGCPAHLQQHGMLQRHHQHRRGGRHCPSHHSMYRHVCLHDMLTLTAQAVLEPSFMY